MNGQFDLEKLCIQAIAIIKPVGNFIRQKRKNNASYKIEKKGERDFVTEIDKLAEEKLVAGLKNIFPEAGFITEENTIGQSDTDYKWVIDPIDGTTNFMQGLPINAVSVALMHKKEIILGIVYEVTMNEIFYTWKNAKSYMNGKQIHVSKCDDVANAVIATGFPYTRTKRLKDIVATLHHFLKSCRDIRRLGSSATDLCYVACGRLDVYYEAYLKIWDIAAGILIVQNAGGVVTDFNGKVDYNKGKIVATNNTLLKKVLKGIEIKA